jgi:hypothetical protein
MPDYALDVIIGAVAVGLWFGGYGLALLVTRPSRPAAAPATQELGQEPPAVASLLVNGWELTEDAAESTLLDLGARGFLEFRQPGNDIMQTTVHVRGADTAGLSAYEHRVLGRVRSLARNGMVPVTALMFRDPQEAANWAKRLRAEIIADARRRGLSRRRFSPPVVSALVSGAFIAAVLVSLAVLHYVVTHHAQDKGGKVFGAGFAAWAMLSLVSGRDVGEKDTPAGREAASRWLGVREWLRGNQAFADLPPAAVAVWDRYLAYGAAVGATRATSAAIDLGMGDCRRPWSHYGGVWHRVRVRYPRFGSHHGVSTGRLVWRTIAIAAIGLVLVRYLPKGVHFVADIKEIHNNPVSGLAGLIITVALVTGGLLLARAAYRMVRIIIDEVSPVTVTGEVLWRKVWRTVDGGENQPDRPVTYYLPIDDARSDHTDAWALPVSLLHSCQVGDAVTVQARRWSRLITSVTVVTPRGRSTEASVDVKPEALIEAAMGGAAGPGNGLGRSAAGFGALAPVPFPATELLSAAEVSEALQQPVEVDGRDATGAPVTTARYRTAGGSELTVVLMGGLAARMATAMRPNLARSGGQPVAGAGEDAYAGPDWAMARRDNLLIILRCDHVPANPAALTHLLGLAVSRMGPAVPSAGSRPRS